MGKRKYIGLLSILAGMLITINAAAGTRIIDKLVTRVGDAENAINIHFDVPVRLISHIANPAKTEINVQVQPTVTPGAAGDLFEQKEILSWNPTAEIPLDKIEFQGEVIGNSTLSLQFATPVDNYEIRQGRDFFNLVVVLKKEKVVKEIVIDQPVPVTPAELVEEPEPQPEAPAPVAPPTKPAVGKYVINLLSSDSPINFERIAPVPVAEGQQLYTTKATIEGKIWHRLRIGFYPSLNEAREELKTVRRFYSSAWIAVASIKERQQVSGKVVMPEPVPPPARLPRRDQEAAPATDRVARMMAKTREVMTAGDYPTAIRLLTAILEEPDNSHSKEALELLGLARERNGQFSHAHSEYSKYLELYPEGEDAVRVKQRLAGLITATQEKPKPELRQTRQVREERPWEIFGSLSQSYRRDGIQSDFVDEEDSVSRSEIDSNIYLSARRRTTEYDMRFQLTGGYVYDLLDDGPGNSSTLSDAYFEAEHRPSEFSAKLGRQRARSSGILNRFDGAYLGYQATEDTRINVAMGLPVESSKDTFATSDKYFFGLSGHIDSIFENVDLSLFAIEQRVDDLIDRRALGGEARYFKDGRSIFGLLDYDIFHERLNTVLIQSNWTLPDQSQVYLNLDHRASPIMVTSNAVQGQTVDNIEDLQILFTADQIYKLADDRTAEATVVSLGGTKLLAKDLQVSGDFSVSNTSGTIASGGVDATLKTGNEYFYSVQVLRNNLLKQGDVGILGLRYADASTSNSVTATASSRYPITSLWRINPRLSATYRENKETPGERISLSGFLQADYRLRKDFLLEMEVGANWHEENDGNDSSTFTDYFFMSGYRWEF